MGELIHKYLKEKSLLETNTQLLFKYFSNLWLLPKLFPKATLAQTTLAKYISGHECVKDEYCVQRPAA